MVTLVDTRAEIFNFLEPPRQGADAAENFQILNRWTWLLINEMLPQFNQLVTNQNALLDRLEEMYTLLDAIEAIADPSTATNQEIAEKTNEILSALTTTTAPTEG